MNEKLLKIQELLKAPKNQRNEFGKYNYRSCEDIFEAVKPILKEQGLTLRVTDELVFVGERYYIKATAILSDGNEIIENVAYAREEETKKGMDGSQITGASSSYARKYALNGLFLIDDVKDSDSTNEGLEPTKEDAKEYVISFGKKHNGHKLTDVIKDDSDYIEWILNNSKDEYLLKCIELLTGKVPLTEEEKNEMLNLMAEVNKLAIEKKIDFDEIRDNYDVKSSKEMSLEQLRDCVVWLKKQTRGE